MVGSVLTTVSAVVTVVALIVAVVVGALFVSGRIAPREEKPGTEGDHEDG